MNFGSAIGFDMSVEEFQSLVNTALTHGDVTASSGTMDLHRFGDKSGPGVFVVTGQKDRLIYCANTFFFSQKSLRIRKVKGFESDCPYCSGVVGWVDEYYPIPLFFPQLHFCDIGNELRLNAAYAARDNVRIFEDEKAFKKSGSPFAPQSLIPAGLFTPDGKPTKPEPVVIMTALVKGSEECVNPYTDQSYLKIDVETYGQKDALILGPDSLKDASRGNILAGTFTAMGSL